MAQAYRFDISGDEFSNQALQDEARKTRSLAGLAVTLVVVVISLFLIRGLQATSAGEGCLLDASGSCALAIVQQI
jgi:hypothetical protein